LPYHTRVVLQTLVERRQYWRRSIEEHAEVTVHKEIGRRSAGLNQLTGAGEGFLCDLGGSVDGLRRHPLTFQDSTIVTSSLVKVHMV